MGGAHDEAAQARPRPLERKIKSYAMRCGRILRRQLDHAVQCLAKQQDVPPDTPQQISCAAKALIHSIQQERKWKIVSTQGTVYSCHAKEFTEDGLVLLL